MEKEMRNLIDRDELIDSLGVSDMEIFAKEVIGDAPTVDAVEVVRCKEGKHYMLWEDSDDKKTCAKSIGLMVSSPDDFCSYGERREGE
ncbi:MAG: hypothetical protein IJX37_08950 [Oscillospiraceae bacterium]|nr:hypothetical protein [Oscillospiraceae bacterium]